MADDWAEAAKSLWAGWDSDAIIADTENGYLADHKKVRYSNYSGEFFRTRGPLNTVRAQLGVVADDWGMTVLLLTAAVAALDAAAG